jgi:membrane peptidoglycan carboxypeptidase
MSYGHTPDGDEGPDDVRGRPSGGTVYGSSGSRGAARNPADNGGSSGSGTVYGGSGRSGGTTYGSNGRGTTYGSGGSGGSADPAGSGGSGGTTYGSSGRGTTYGSGAAGNGGTTYGAKGTTYGSGSASGGTTYGSGAGGQGTTYGSSANQGTPYGARGTTYGSGTAVGERPTGIGPRSRAAAYEEDSLQPEFGGDPAQAPPGAKARKRKKILIGVGIGVVVSLLLGVLGGGVAYATTDLPAFPKVSQTTRVEYADGTQFASFATENRVEVKLKQVPTYVQNEVVAAEDQDFWDNGGVSIRGTGRAIWGLVTGNDAGGGSTITQQYVRNALNLTRGRSYTRKVKEIILAQKLSSNMSKQDILQGYLNTIYFGRSAWGIQAASKAYFNKDVSKLTPAEGAVLASVIKDPTNFDPKNNMASAKGRWTYVMDSMAKKGFMSSTDRAAQVYPTATLVVKESTSNAAWRSGSTGVLGYRIEQELKKIGFSEQDINTGGLVVKTTISSAAQASAAKASRYYVNSGAQDPRMGTAMVSIAPTTGAVVAYYGGEGGYGSLDLASSASPHQPGSSFKPYVLATALTQGYSIDSLWDGTSGQTFPDRKTPLTNSDGESCSAQCPLTKAMVLSINTVFWALTDAVEGSYKSVAKTANAAGIQKLDRLDVATQIKNGGLNTGLGLGQFQVSVMDQATGYATIADYGTYHQPYFITQVLNSDGSIAYDHSTHVGTPTQAWSHDVGRDVNYVLEQDYNANTKNQIGRQAAIKTGTQQYKNTTENSQAWLCGFTPQLATAVWVGSKTTDFALRDKANGNIHVYGNGIPGSIWTDYMESALKKQKVASFEEPLHAGSKTGNAKSDSPSPSPTEPGTPDATQSDGNGWDSTDPNASPTDGQSTGTDGSTTNNNGNGNNNSNNGNNNGGG